MFMGIEVIIIFNKKLRSEAKLDLMSKPIAFRYSL